MTDILARYERRGNGGITPMPALWHRGFQQSMTNSMKGVLRSIEAVLWTDWDPIGVRDSNGHGPTDEYDVYAPSVLQLVEAGAAPMAIAEHLARLEQRHMGISPTPDQHRLAVAAAAYAALGRVPA